MIENNILGIRMKTRREQLNISAVELAETLGLTKATIHRYEAGDIKNIKLPVIEAIASALNVNPDWLIGKSDEMCCTNISTNEKEEKDVYNMLLDIINYIDVHSNLTYKNRPMTDDFKLSLKTHIEAIIYITDKFQS